MLLTNKKVKAAKPTSKPYKMADERGLFLLVNPNGSKYWRFKYRVLKKEKSLAFGVYPQISLKKARELRDEVRQQLARGIDPAAHKKAQKNIAIEQASNSFQTISLEWFAKQKDQWVESHASRVLRRLERDVFPWLGAEPATSITAPKVLRVLRRIEERDAIETAHRAMSDISRVMRYAIATGRAERDPCPDLKDALQTPKVEHFPAITDPVEVSAFLRTLDGYKGLLTTRIALRLAPLLFVRPGELRTAQWAEINLETAEWRYRASKTKTDHLAPLSRQAVAALRELQPLTGHCRWVFPGRDPQKPMSEATINAALRRMGFDTQSEITGHGVRAMARTILAEHLHFKPEVIEHQLAHRVADPLGGAYNRTKFIVERKQMMQVWADYLDQLRCMNKLENRDTLPPQAATS